MFFFSFSYIFWGNMKNRNHFLAGPVLMDSNVRDYERTESCKLLICKSRARCLKNVR